MPITDRPASAAGRPGGARKVLAAWSARPAARAALLLTATAALITTSVIAGVRPVLQVDAAVAAHLHSLALEHPAWTHASRIITDWVVGPWTMRLLLAGTVIWLWRHRQRLRAAWAACTCAVEAAVRGMLRWLIGRERPEWERPVDSADFAAMPSGHAMTTAATCVLLLWAARTAHVPAGLLRTGPIIAALAVITACFTRIHLGVHWLTDTFAGAVLGAALSTAAIAAYPHREQALRPHPGSRLPQTTSKSAN